MEKISITEHTAIDWASFHREVVFESMIMRHEQIGYLVYIYYIYIF